MEKIYEGLGILLKYKKGYFAAEHDEVFAEGPPPAEMDPEDVRKLEAIHWRYGDMGWATFV